MEEKRRFYKILLWFTKVSDTGASLQNKDTAAHSQKGKKDRDRERENNKRTREKGKTGERKSFNRKRNCAERSADPGGDTT